MYLRDLTMRSFIIVRADWPAKRVLELLSSTRATHVIVHRSMPGLPPNQQAGQALVQTNQAISTEKRDYYYLYPIGRVRDLLMRSPQQMSVQEAFDLHEFLATETRDAYSNAKEAPGQAVIIDDGRVVGFIDENFVPSPGPRSFRSTAVKPEAQPRLLSADFPEKIPLHETRSLLVSLSAAIQTAQENLAAKAITVAIGTSLKIIVLAKRGFTLKGTGETTLVVTDQEDIQQFEVTAVEVGLGDLRVLAFSGGQCLCTITLKPMVVEENQALVEERVAEVSKIGTVSIQDPDLSLLILEYQNNGKPALEFRLNAHDPNLGLNFKSFGPITLLKDPAVYFQEFFQDIEGLSLKNDYDKAVVQEKLAAKGTTLFKNIIPDDLQTVLWDLKDRIRSVQVQSFEPWIPWELCKLQGKNNVKGAFFCEAFEMTRWLLEIPIKPALHLNNMALVIPKDSGLPYAPQERDYMLSLARDGRAVTRLPANYLNLKHELSDGAYDSWHFTGHGGSHDLDPNLSEMKLEDGNCLTPEDLSGLELANPLVFLNACQIGRGDMSLTGIGGFARQFLSAGAAAFIGAYWSIYDLAAANFAREFYNRLLSGQSIGKTAKEARLAIKSLGDPTWLAYTVYASPSAAVIRP